MYDPGVHPPVVTCGGFWPPTNCPKTHLREPVSSKTPTGSAAAMGGGGFPVIWREKTDRKQREEAGREAGGAGRRGESRRVRTAEVRRVPHGVGLVEIDHLRVDPADEGAKEDADEDGAGDLAGESDAHNDEDDDSQPQLLVVGVVRCEREVEGHERRAVVSDKAHVLKACGGEKERGRDDMCERSSRGGGRRRGFAQEGLSVVKEERAPGPTGAPMMARKRPMPHAMARRMHGGHDLTMSVRTPMNERPAKTKPAIQMAARAVCQGTPNFPTMVKAKKALVPMPGASANGKLDMRPMRMHAMPEDAAVATTRSGSHAPNPCSLSGLMAFARMPEFCGAGDDDRAGAFQNGRGRRAITKALRQNGTAEASHHGENVHHRQEGDLR